MDYNGTINCTLQEQDNSQTTIVRNAALGFSLVLNIWICLMFRTALFSVSWMNLSPVNVMIMVDESIKMITLFGQSFLVYHTIEGGETKLSDTVFGSSCWILFLASHTGIATSYLGGAAIALVRLIHIKHQWILKKLGKFWTVMCLEALQVVCISGIIYGRYQKLQSKEVKLQDCFPNIKIDNRTGQRNLFRVLGSLLLLAVMELFIYLSIFLYLYKHNLSMHLVTSEKNMRKEIRKNALDLSTHFLHFVAEIVQTIGWLLANLTFKINLNVYSLLLFVFQNGLLSLLIISTSPIIRNKYIDIFITNRNHLFSTIAMLIISLIVALTNVRAYLI